MTILVTGAAGFIGFHVAKALLERGEAVLGIDNLNDYYAVRLKQARLARLQSFRAFSFVQLDIADRNRVVALVDSRKDLRTASSISRRRPGYAIRWIIPMPMLDRM